MINARLILLTDKSRCRSFRSRSVPHPSQNLENQTRTRHQDGEGASFPARLRALISAAASPRVPFSISRSGVFSNGKYYTLVFWLLFNILTNRHTLTELHEPRRRSFRSRSRPAFSAFWKSNGNAIKMAKAPRGQLRARQLSPRYHVPFSISRRCIFNIWNDKYYTFSFCHNYYLTF